MKEQTYYAIYIAIGFIYYLVNIFIRKLHTKNEEGDGWILVPFWIFLWFIPMIVFTIQGIRYLILKARGKYSKISS